MKRQCLLALYLARACASFQPSGCSRRRPHITSSLYETTTASELPEMDELPSMEPFSHDLDTPSPVENAMIRDGIPMNSTLNNDLKMAPPLTFNKFLTMQDKRVVATIRYTNGLKPYYLTAAKKIKASHPDVVIEKRILPALGGEGGNSDTTAFEILVDDKIVVGNQRSRKQRVGDGSVYVSMQEMDLAISKARRKRRPSTLYGEEPGMRLEMLRKSQQEAENNGSKDSKNKWKD